MIEILIPLILSSCGMIMITSLSLRNSAVNPYSLSFKQLVFTIIGITLTFGIMNASTETFKKLSGRLFVISFVLLFLTTIPGIGIKVGGARRWLGIGGTRIQPLEIALFTLPIFMADRLTDKTSTMLRGNFHSFVRPTLMLIISFGVPLMLQPNLGGTIIVAAICFVMHIERRGWKWPLRGLIIGVLLVSFFILIAPYRMRRFNAFMDPWQDPTDRGFQIIQGLIAFANGSVTGVGIGKGLQQKRYLPEAQTDYIFPAIGEEFGLIGTLFIIILYAVWTWRVYYIYRDAKTPFTKSLALGLTASTIFPMFINVAGVTKLMPLSGIPMPFISAGGSSMVFNWIKVGLLLAIKRENNLKVTRKKLKKNLNLNSEEEQENNEQLEK